MRVTGKLGGQMDKNYAGPWILFIGYLAPRDIEMKHDVVLPALSEAGFAKIDYDHDEVHLIPDREGLIRATVLVEGLIAEHDLDITIEFEQADEETLKQSAAADDAKKITCPLCQGAEMEYSQMGKTHVWNCPVCPARLFELYDEEDVKNQL